MKIKGVVATGHPKTTEVAELILKEGGNAFDATVAAYFMACITEPVLASLGGGGFLMAKTPSGSPFSLDFFVQTPSQKKPDSQLDFEEIMVDFGSAIQYFHMGYGSMAVPGCVKGMFEIHRNFCRIPMLELLGPAINAAKTGIAINQGQANVLSLVYPIYSKRDSARALFVNVDQGTVLQENQIYQNGELADVFDLIAREGESFFYEGEIAQKIDQISIDSGGSLNLEDLKKYEIIYRTPTEFHLNGVDVYLNPPPSAGGLLVNFALELFCSQLTSSVSHGDQGYYDLLANSIELTQQARIEAIAQSAYRELETEFLFDSENLNQYKNIVATKQKANKGTTHISIADDWGNVAALTISNGEGCGEILPQTGIMMNNMLGEDDLNPLGLNQWQPDRRLSSMMCPGIAIKGNQLLAVGSGGSNRIRTAILQVLINNLLFDLSLADSVNASRLHFDDELYLESPNIKQGVINDLSKIYPDMKIFPERDFYFGGVNAVSISDNNTQAIADPRRGGSATIVR